VGFLWDLEQQEIGVKIVKKLMRVKMTLIINKINQNYEVELPKKIENAEFVILTPIIKEKNTIKSTGKQIVAIVRDGKAIIRGEQKHLVKPNEDVVVVPISFYLQKRKLWESKNPVKIELHELEFAEHPYDNLYILTIKTNPPFEIKLTRSEASSLALKINKEINDEKIICEHCGKEIGTNKNCKYCVWYTKYDNEFLFMEELSKFIHNLWMKWSKELTNNEKLSESRIKRWKKLWIPYEELPEYEKEKDREIVRKIIKIVDKYVER